MYIPLTLISVVQNTKHLISEIQNTKHLISVVQNTKHLLLSDSYSPFSCQRPYPYPHSCCLTSTAHNLVEHAGKIASRKDQQRRFPGLVPSSNPHNLMHISHPQSTSGRSQLSLSSSSSSLNPLLSPSSRLQPLASPPGLPPTTVLDSIDADGSTTPLGHQPHPHLYLLQPLHAARSTSRLSSISGDLPPLRTLFWHLYYTSLSTPL